MAPELPDRTLVLHCYHVGQLDESDARDASYQGRGIGLGLLDALIDWALACDFDALIAKATPAQRSVMAFMGGQPANAYGERGFEIESTWLDLELLKTVEERKLGLESGGADEAAQVSCCVRRLRPRSA